jgi:hypothetical protein
LDLWPVGEGRFVDIQDKGRLSDGWSPSFHVLLSLPQHASDIAIVAA